MAALEPARFVAEVSPSTASDHLTRLRDQLVVVLAQGKHRYYSLEGPTVAAALEALTVIAGEPHRKFVPTTPSSLRLARTCYDHMAGKLAVALYDEFTKLDWFIKGLQGSESELSGEGQKGFAQLGIDLEATRARRRRFACSCLDWSERRPHLGGALGAAFLNLALSKNWVTQDLNSRMLRLTERGRREIKVRFGFQD